ncbi:MAG: stalk domain-containing protein [Methylocystaceae bacterium]
MLVFISLPVQADMVGFKININQQQLVIKAPTPQPLLIKDRVYVPLRVVSENLGAQVKWDQLNQQVLLTTKGKNEAVVPVRNSGIKAVRIVVDGSPLTIPADLGSPFIKAPGFTMVPLRAVAMALDCDVNWNAGLRVVTVDAKPVITLPATPETPVVAPPVTTPPVATDPVVDPIIPPVVPGSITSSLFEELASYGTNLKLLDGRVINSASLKGRNEAEFNTEQIQQLNKLLAEIKKYPRSLTLPNGQAIDTYNLSIMGNSVASAEQLQRWAAANATRIQSAKNLPPKPVPDLADIYLRIGAEYGVRGDLAFCQAAKETGYWQFSGQVRPEQNNYCGLFAIGSALTGLESLNGADPTQVSIKAGTHGAWFVTPQAGVEAQIQHLYAYATKNSLPTGKVIIDPRYKLVSKGIAPTWTALNARWAVPGTTYGQSIIQDYWLKVFNSNQ